MHLQWCAPGGRASELVYSYARTRHLLPLSHKTTDLLCGPRTPRRARWPLFARPRPILYGDPKKPTHDHQTVRPFGPTSLQPVPAMCSSTRRARLARSQGQATPGAAATGVRARAPGWRAHRLPCAYPAPTLYLPGRSWITMVRRRIVTRTGEE